MTNEEDILRKLSNFYAWQSHICDTAWTGHPHSIQHSG